MTTLLHGKSSKTLNPDPDASPSQVHSMQSTRLLVDLPFPSSTDPLPLRLDPPTPNSKYFHYVAFSNVLRIFDIRGGGGV